MPTSSQSSTSRLETPDPTRISPEQFVTVARGLQVDEAVLRAVAQVESAGSGFIRPGKPKILFEGHAFYRLTGGRFGESNISYRKWTKKYYSSPDGEWARLEAACKLDRPAGLQSASWGMFQIMGFNYSYCGYADVEEFVAAQCDNADRQLGVFARFISRPPFLAALRDVRKGADAKDDNVAAWTRFAEAYNGPRHQENNYVGKLQQAHKRWLAALEPRAGARAGDAAEPDLRTEPLLPADESEITPGKPQFAEVRTTVRRTPSRRRNVKPDAVDLRDWEYQPNIAIAPSAWVLPNNPRPTKNQRDSNACTGFALATVIEYLLARSDRPVESISGYMLYNMAQRYDEWANPVAIEVVGEKKRPASTREPDEGSSIRGALKGWSKHGASRATTWKDLGMPNATNLPDDDWWLDAVGRPMGAYYRIAPKNIRDMHIALQEAGAIYASAFTHSGWESLIDHPRNGAPTGIDVLPVIPAARSHRDQGHAFAIVGYTSRGFVVQNSWGEKWGRGGLAVLTYDDWMENAMDCWVAQLGVVTQDHEEVARSSGLHSVKAGSSKISRDVNLADHEISPYIINMENNGLLSTRGRFRTSDEDVRLLVDYQMLEACKLWNLKRNDTLDVAIYAHGGLTTEDAAAATARNWIPYLFSKRIFPIFLMWETGIVKTFNNILQDSVFGTDEKVAGGWLGDLRDSVAEWKDERLEGLARWPGGKLWNEMKQNAQAIADNDDSGAIKLFSTFNTSAHRASLPKRIRLHLIGHSAGAIVHTHLAPKALKAGLEIASISLMAPAVRMDTFKTLLGSEIAQRRIRVMLANLTDAAELADGSCKPYGRSLLYLVSRSFEGQEPTPLLGMERYLVPTLPTVDWSVNVDYLPSPGGTWDADCGVTRATSHGGMDDDPGVRQAVASFIRFGSRRDRMRGT